MRTFYCKITLLFLTVWIYVVMWKFTHFEHVKIKYWKGNSKDKSSTEDDTTSNFARILKNENNLAKTKFEADTLIQNITIEKSKLNESNAGLFCAVQSNWNSRYNFVSISAKSNFKSWTFEEQQNCSSFRLVKILNIQPKYTFSIRCLGKNVTVFDRTISRKKMTNDHIFRVNFGDICLQTYIDKCCKDNLPVPNVIHYVRYRKDLLTFYEFVSFVSVIRFVRPCAILIHGDKLPTGDYWNYIITLSPNIVHVRRDPPSVIFGKKPYFKEHASDLMRIEALILYGGIYLDTDTVIVKSLEPLRKYPCTMSSQSSGYMSSAFIMAERNATFLQKWLDGYKYDYNVRNYVYNAMTYPKYIYRENTDLIHVELGKLSRPWTQIGYKIYYTNWNWKLIYGIHLFSRSSKKRMTVELLKHFNSTVGSICRHVLFGNKELCFTR